MPDLPGNPPAAEEDRSADRDIEFGMKAIEAGHVQPLHLQSALRKLNERRTLGDRTSLPQILLELGLMTKGQVKEVLNALAATVLVCTNPSCNSEFKVRAYDPGRKYKCSRCKSPLRAMDPEDQAELTDQGQVTITGAELQKQIEEFYDITAAAPPPPPEFSNLHKPIDRTSDWDDSEVGADDDEINVEDDPRKELTQRRQMSGEIQIAGVPVRPKKKEKRKDTERLQKEKTMIAGVPIDIGSSDEESADASYSGTYSSDEPPPVGTALGKNDFRPAAGVPDAGDMAAMGYFDEEDEDLPEPGEVDEGDQPATASRGRRATGRGKAPKQKTKKQPRPAKPKIKKVRQGPPAVLIVLVVLILLGGAGYGGYYVYTQILGSPGLAVNTGTTDGGGSDDGAGGDKDELREDIARGRRQLARIAGGVAGGDEVLPAIEKAQKLVERTPALTDAHVVIGQLNRLRGHRQAAEEAWTRAITADAPPAGIRETPHLRDKAGFLMALLRLLDENACDPTAARIAFAEVVGRARDLQTQPDGSGADGMDDEDAGGADGADDGTGGADGDGAGDEPEPVGPSPWVAASELLANPDVAGALAQSDGATEWPVRLTRGLLLAAGMWPGEPPHASDDADLAAATIGQALDDAGADGHFMVGVRMFHGLLVGAYVSNRNSNEAIAGILAASQRTGSGLVRQTAALYRARISLATNDYASAKKTLTDEEVALPGAAVVRARIALARDDYRTALDLLEPVTDRVPDARRLMGRVFYALGRYQEAQAALAGARSPDALADLGMAQLLAAIHANNRDAIRAAADRLAAAAEMRRHVDVPHRDDAKLFARAGYALYRAGRFDESETAFTRAAQIDATHPELQLWRGKRDLDNGEPTEALEGLKAVINHDPTNWRAFFFAGQCQLALGETDDAAHSFRKALDLSSPDAPERAEIQQLLDAAER